MTIVPTSPQTFHSSLFSVECKMLESAMRMLLYEILKMFVQLFVQETFIVLKEVGTRNTSKVNYPKTKLGNTYGDLKCSFILFGIHVKCHFWEYKVRNRKDTFPEIFAKFWHGNLLFEKIK